MYKWACEKYTNQGKQFSDGTTTLNYFDEGSGRTILFLHGFGASSYSWKDIVDFFKKNYRVISIDLKGFGLSDKPVDSEYDILSQAKHVSNFILRHDLKDITVVGHSLGGGVSIATYINMELKNESHRIHSLVLIDPACYPQSLPFFMHILTMPVLKDVSRVLPSRLQIKMVLNTVYYDKKLITRETIDTYAYYLDLEGSHTATQKTVHCLNVGAGSDLVRSYGLIDCPVAIVWGANDTIILPVLGERLLRDLPLAELHIVERCGHAPQEECPLQTAEIINSFFDKQNV